MTSHASTRTELIAHARRRDGVFTVSDARGCGVTHRMLQHLEQRQEIVRVHRSVYRFAHVPVTAAGMLRAALAASSGRAVASHSSAAMLLGLHDVAVGLPEITIPTHDGHVPRLHRVRVHQSRNLPADDRTQVRGIPCTTGSRTLIDLCSRFPEHVNMHRADQAICAGIASRGTLHARATALKSGRRGVRKLAEITAPEADGTFWSALERAFGQNLQRYDLATPEYNAPINVAGRLYYADALWRPSRLVVELHGMAFHRMPADRASDDERLNAFVSIGLRTLVFGWRQVMYEFDEVARVIRQAL
jgi:very-short-patch-repair endonuclease